MEMKKILISGFLYLFAIQIDAQAIELVAIDVQGASDQFINLVIIGDGYTETQQEKFVNDAKSFKDYLFTLEPFKNYADFFNIYAIKVVSVDSGARHDNSAPDCPGINSHPILKPNTYFDVRFDAGNIHRLVVPFKAGNISSTLSKFFPLYDQVVLLSNTPYYGGSGGVYSTSTLHRSSNEISAHELGHSFAGLADEYYAGDQYAGEFRNMTKVTDSTLIKWKSWLGYKNVGIYQHCCGGNSALWYKPNQSCKMQALGNPFCPVCIEGIIESIHNLASSVVAYSPLDTSINLGDSSLKFKLLQLIKPIPNTLKVEWKFKNQIVSDSQDSVTILSKDIPLGKSVVNVFVQDTSKLLRINNHKNLHFDLIQWNINKTLNSIGVTNKKSKLFVDIYPIPANDFLNFTIQSELKSRFRLRIISTEGREFLNKELPEFDENYQEKINMYNCPEGNYILQLFGNGLTLEEKFQIVKD